MQNAAAASGSGDSSISGLVAPQSVHGAPHLLLYGFPFRPSAAGNGPADDLQLAATSTSVERFSGVAGVPRFFSGVVSSITVATSDFRRLLVSLVSSPSGKWCPRARKAPTIADERMEVKHPGVPLARFEELLQLQLPLAVV